MKKAGVTILIWNKMDFQPKVIKIDKEVHFILFKGTLTSEHLCSKFKGIHIHKRNFT